MSEYDPERLHGKTRVKNYYFNLIIYFTSYHGHLIRLIFYFLQ